LLIYKLLEAKRSDNSIVTLWESTELLRD